MYDVKIAVLGGDLRQAALSSLLAADFYECAVFGLDGADTGAATHSADLEGALRGASAVVLPLPVSRDGKTVNAPLCQGRLKLKDVNALIPACVPVLGGLIRAEDFPGKAVFDYYGEELQTLNGIPTAEGAIAIAMSELPTTLHGTKTLILGFGRVGKALGLALRGLGAVVSAATRNASERAFCEVLGFEALNYASLASEAGAFGLVFNTVPAPVLTESVLRNLPDGVPVIDLASAPGGVDAMSAERLGKKLIRAPGLPGKVAPVTAGAYIGKAVYSILREENVI